MEPPRLTQLISRASRALTRSGDAVLKPLGLRYAQVPVIVLLRREGGLTQKALAAAAGIEQPSMAQLLSRMDRDGLVRRRPHPRDARSQVITLAEGDDARIAAAQQRLTDLEQRAIAGLTGEEASVLRTLLLRVMANLEGEGALGTTETGLSVAAASGSRPADNALGR